MQVQQRSDLEACVRDVRSKVHGEMEHAYLSGYFHLPDLEGLQLVAADAMMQAAGVPREEADTVVSTLLLIYHGLAVHDDIEMLASQPDEKYRQLGVLAGIYYSSKYYRLLAMTGQVALVGRYARAIQSINEAKSELERDPADFAVGGEKYMQLQETIHGALLHELRAAYLPDDSDWQEIVTLLVRASVLHKELSSQDQTWVRTLANLLLYKKAGGEERRWLKHLPLGKGHDPRLLSLHVKYGTSADVYRMLETSVGLIEPALSLLPRGGGDLRGLCERLTEFLPLTRRAEEG